jgi:sugar lactone lactonase YvrE
MSRMLFSRLGFVLGLAVLSFDGGLFAADTLPPSVDKEDARLIPAYQSNRIWNGVTATSGGRIFVAFTSAEGTGTQLGEIGANGKATPYPTVGWNAWSPGVDPGTAFVHVNSIRIGPDGMLWVVDAGAPGIGKPSVSHGARLIRFDLAKNAVDRIYALDSAVKPDSFVDDVRFNGTSAYLTDAGAPGLLVLNLTTGVVRRVLDNDPSMTDRRPMMADGRLLRDEKGKELRVHADQIEVSADGHIYYQPASGPMSRIESRWLDDATLDPALLTTYVEPWLDTPTSGGTAIDAQGNIYLGDANRRRILKIAPDKTVTTLIEDPRLVWSDAMWIDHDGFLWIPATQQNLTPGFNGGGKNGVHYPVWIYKMKIGVGPLPGDHS